jgi:hypothetical protein
LSSSPFFPFASLTLQGKSINRLIWGYQAEKLLVETLSALEITRNDPHFDETDCNHIVLNLLPVISGTMVDGRLGFIFSLYIYIYIHFFF